MELLIEYSALRFEVRREVAVCGTGGGHLGVHCGCYLQEGAREEQTGTGTDKVGMRLFTSISRPWLFWVKQARQRRWGGRISLYTVTSAGAGGGGRCVRAAGCYLYRVGP